MRQYSRHELEGMDTTTLRAICKELRIRPEKLSVFDDKEAMIELIFKYRGHYSDRYINEWDERKVKDFEIALREKGVRANDKGDSLSPKEFRVETPAYFNIYKGIESLNERGSEHKVYTEAKLDKTSAVLLDESRAIQAFIHVSKGSLPNSYLLKLKGHMLNPSVQQGIYRNYTIIFFPMDFHRISRIFHKTEQSSAQFRYIEEAIQEVAIQDIKETDDMLVIDYGTSYTTAGTYDGNRIRYVWFHSEEPCEYDSGAASNSADCKECGRCALCPSVIAVNDCSMDGVKMVKGDMDEIPSNNDYDGISDVRLLYGHEAKNRLPMSRNSIFFDTKRWVNNYRETVEVKDMAGNTSSINRSSVIRGFMKYVIRTAERQNKVKYKNICFTCPVKQKGMSLSMYKDILHDYNVEERDAVDEAVAVVYDSVASNIEELNYDSGIQRSVLLIDCGGSTSDMVKCDYNLVRLRSGSRVSMAIGYANGDTNFGGNNLTYRIMQYVKIRLADYYGNKDGNHASVPSFDGFSAANSKTSIEALLNTPHGDVYEHVDEAGILSVYENFEEAYAHAGATIPTNYIDYINDAESTYSNIRGNFYFLWDMAEHIKVQLYSSSGAYEFSLSQLKENKSLYMLTTKGKNGAYATHSEHPPLRFMRDEINFLLKPQIYNLIKKFVEPFYMEDENMSGITSIMLSGQTTKIELFRDVLKEYIAGQKARAPFEHSYAKKIKCIRGAVTYQGAKAIGRIRASVKYESPTVPYSLAAETFNDAVEKTLIAKGATLSDIYGFVDRPIGIKLIVFSLRDHDGVLLQDLRVPINVSQYNPTDWDELLKTYYWLEQGDVDRIEDGDVRIFVYSDDESWGFKHLGIANDDGRLYRGEPKFLPFESAEWELNFFDGKK